MHVIGSVPGRRDSTGDDNRGRRSLPRDAPGPLARPPSGPVLRTG
jgi:hypothetical protein